MVEYGFSKRPSTPIRLNCSSCLSRYFCAYLRHSSRTSSGFICNFFPPSCWSTFISMGKPWQSQPGMYGASNPAIFFDLTTKSFRHLFRSEEHTSELQSLTNLVCRLLLEKKNTRKK